MKFWCLLLTLLSALAASAQKPALDRLQEQVRAHSAPDTARVNLLNSLAFELRSTAPRRSWASFQEARKLARQLQYPAGEAEAWLGLGFYHRKRNEYGPALAYTQQAEQAFRQLNDSLRLIACAYNLGYTFSGQGNYARALTYAQQGRVLAEALQNQHWLVLMNMQLGNISTELDDNAKARHYLLRGLELARQAANLPGVSQGLRGLGELHRTQRQWAEAQRYYEQDAPLAQRLGDRPGYVVDVLNIADMNERQGRYAEAFANGYKVLGQLRRLDVVGYLPWAQLVLARAHLHTGHPDSALHYGRASLKASQRTGVKENARDVSEVLTQASLQLGHFADAYRYQRLYGAYKDSLSSRDLIRRITALEYSHDLARQQGQIALLTKNEQLVRQQNRQQQWLLGGSFLGLGLVCGLSMVLWRSNQQKQRAYAQLEQQQAELVATQTQLVASEKWAFVGELSAGIAHELQNPLAFMKNFAEVSVALLGSDAAGGAPVTAAAGPDLEQEIVAGLKQNLQQISQHGHRASAIISDMLAHARAGTSPREATDLNALIEQHLHLAYQGLQAKDAAFSATITTELDAAVGSPKVVASEVGRVLLNLFTNALQAVQERQRQAEAGYEPAVRVSSVREGGQLIIRVHDNGLGMSAAVQQQIFQPFFTTKPLGEGTGLGLSLSYDIVTKGHGGTLTAESQEGQYAEFVLQLPG